MLHCRISLLFVSTFVSIHEIRGRIKKCPVVNWSLGFDVEYAIGREAGLVDEATVIVTTVHPLRIVEEVKT